MSLPEDSQARKEIPITTGVLDYFPNALAAVAEVSKKGNDKHNPGEPLHWSREKSNDHADCITRHLMDRGKIGKDGIRHSAEGAWRYLALLEEELIAEGAEPGRGTSHSGEVEEEVVELPYGSRNSGGPRLVRALGRPPKYEELYLDPQGYLAHRRGSYSAEAYEQFEAYEEVT